MAKANEPKITVKVADKNTQTIVKENEFLHLFTKSLIEISKEISVK